MDRRVLLILGLLVLAQPAAAQFKTDPDNVLQVDVVRGTFSGGGGGGTGTVAAPSIAGGNATASAPSGQTGAEPLSMDANGNLRVILSNAITIGAGTAAIGSVSVTGSVAVTGAFYQTTQPVSGTFFQATQPVSGTFFQATQPVSLASVPLPAGASISALQPAINADGGALVHVTNPSSGSGGTGTVASPSIAGGNATASAPTGQSGAVPLSQDSNGNLRVVQFGAVTLGAGSAAIGSVTVSGSVPVTGAFYQSTQPVSAASLPLAPNAAIASLQPPLTTPGTLSTQGLSATTIATQVTFAAPSAASVATGGTAVTAATPGTIVHGCDLLNPSTATEALYFNLTGPATTTASGANVPLPAGGYYHCPFGTTQAMSVNAATSGHAYALVVY